MKHAYAEQTPLVRSTGATPVASVEAVQEQRRSPRSALFEGTGWLRVRLLGDLGALALGNVAAIVGAPATANASQNQHYLWLLPALVCALMFAWGLYRDTIQARIVDDLGRAIAATALASIGVIAAVALLDATADPAPLIARAWVFGTVYLCGVRVLLAWAHRRARATRLVAKRTLIVGAGVVGAHVERRLDRQPELGLLPVGYLDADPPPADMVPDRTVPVLGAPSEIGRVAAETGARHVVLGFSSAPDSDLIPLVRECEVNGLEVSLVPRLFESVNVHVALDHLGGLPLFGLHSIDPKGWQFAIKHVFDRAVAAALLVLLAPLLAMLAVAVRLSSPGPVFFRQRRIGRDGRRFDMLKFRSMRDDPLAVTPAGEVVAPDNVYTLPSDLGPGGVEGIDRRTRVGAFMRRLSLDELPQLVNVLRGDMSLVGPRPERPEFVDIFGPAIHRYDDRHRVKSGITGWAQVNGLRGKTSLRDRVEWDNYYIENWSLGLDLKILLLTISSLSHRAE